MQFKGDQNSVNHLSVLFCLSSFQTGILLTRQLHFTKSTRCANPYLDLAHLKASDTTGLRLGPARIDWAWTSLVTAAGFSSTLEEIPSLPESLCNFLAFRRRHQISSMNLNIARARPTERTAIAILKPRRYRGASSERKICAPYIPAMFAPIMTLKMMAISIGSPIKKTLLRLTLPWQGHVLPSLHKRVTSMQC